MSALRGIRVPLPAGAVTVSAVFETADDTWASLVLAHGAGTGHDHPFLVGFAEALRERGVSTLRFNFPYAEAGRRMPGPPASSVATWAAVFAEAGAWSDAPAFAGGKSYGGRMASMAAAEGRIDPVGLVYLGYPLHPPGKPDRPRIAHLPAIRPPQLFVEGTGDPFVDPHDQLEAVVASCASASIRWLEGGGHSFEVKGRRRPPAEVGAGLAPLVAEWMRAQL